MFEKFKNREAFLRTCREFYFQLVDLDSMPAAADSQQQQQQPSTIEHGKIRREFANFLKPLFVKEFGENGRLLGELTEAELKKRLESLRERVREYQVKEGNLGDYSPWLRNFKRNPAKDLEIPGKF